MKTYIIIILIVLVVLLLIRSICKVRNKEESKLSIFEHPATFKKPDIEMVSKAFTEADKVDSAFQIEPNDPDKKR